jgi:hypothetical protein
MDREGSREGKRRVGDGEMVVELRGGRRVRK